MQAAPFFRPHAFEAPRLDIAVGRRSTAAFAKILPVLLAGLALFDRGFSYVGIPGANVYITEMVLSVGVLAALCTVRPLRVAARLSAIPTALLAVMLVWGGVRTLTQFPAYGIDALRDYAVIYYGSFALVVAAVVANRPDWRDELLRAYRRLIPWLLAWSAVAIALSALGRAVGPNVPGSGVAFLDHRMGNLEVHLAVALAFLWLVPGVSTARQRRLYTTFGLLLLAGGATQNRGGFVSATLILGIAFAIAGSRRKEAWHVIGALVIVFVLLATVSPKIQNDRRTLSLQQLTENLGTLTGSSGSGDLDKTVAWRDALWQTVLSRSLAEDKALLGWGFGPNLGVEFAFGREVDLERPLRSPHNSHLDIIARMGPVGAVLWGALWVTWAGSLIRRRKFLRDAGDLKGAALAEILMLAALAVLVNAYFDPSLENPAAASWLWVVFGLGLTLGSKRVIGAKPPSPGTSLAPAPVA